MERIAYDARLALRVLRKDPWFTTLAALTLALGIGVSTALFSVVNGAWLNAYPYRDAGAILYPRATSLSSPSDSQNGVYRLRELQAMRDVPAVADAAAYTLGRSVTVVGAFGPEVRPAFHVTGNTAQFLGVPPLLGRMIQPSDIHTGGNVEPVVVLSFNLWRGMFNGSRDVVGQTVLLNDVPHRIVGVMPQRFGWGSNSVPTNDGVWLPLSELDASRLRVWIRLAEDVPASVGTEQLHARFLQMAEVAGSFPRDRFVTDLRQFVLGTGGTRIYIEQMRASLTVLLVAVGFLLLIACTNVANLQLARGATRRREFAIRLAIGGSRISVFRQLLAENVVLALLAGVAGVALSIGLTQLVVALIPRGYVPAESEIVVNIPVLLFGVAISTITGVVFGVLPALEGSRADLNETLKDTNVTSGGRRGSVMRNALVVSEVALAVVLVTGASLAARTYQSLANGNAGFDPDGLLMVGMGFRERPGAAPTIDRRDRFLSDLLERLERLPDVEATTFDGVGRANGYSVPGEAPQPRTPVVVRGTGENYADALRLRLLRGRGITNDEVLRGDRVAVINESAQRMWTSGRDPIGDRITLFGLGGASAPAMEWTVVGVVADIEETDPPTTEVLVPYTAVAGSSPGLPALVVRLRDDLARGMNAVRAQAFALDPDVVLQRPLDLSEFLSAGRLQPRFNLALFGALALIALALSAAGIYALQAYHVARQRREIGIRLALGAGTRRVVSRVLASGARLVGAGLVIGVAGSLALKRLVTSQVFAVPDVDVVALATSVLVLGLAGLCACYLPARRAARVDPLSVMKTE